MTRPRLQQTNVIENLLARQHAGVSDFQDWLTSTKLLKDAPLDGASLRPTLSQLVSMLVEDQDLYRDVLQGVRTKIGDRQHAALVKQASPKLARQRGTVDTDFYLLAHRQLRLQVTPRYPPKQNGSSLHSGERLGHSLLLVVSDIASYLDAGDIMLRRFRTSLFLKLCNQAKSEVAHLYPGPNASKHMLVNYEQTAIKRLFRYQDLAERRFGITNPDGLRDVIG